MFRRLYRRGGMIALIFRSSVGLPGLYLWPDVLVWHFIRGASHYKGEVRRAKRGGHIPGAISVPYKSLLATHEVNGKPYKTFQEPEKLRGILEKAGVDLSSPACVYCNGGVASTVVIFALLHLSNNNEALNYDGSWNEWGNKESLPVEV